MRLIAALVLVLLQGASHAGLPAPPPAAGADAESGLRAAAVRSLAARSDPGALATAAALTWVGSGARSKAESARASGAALELVAKAAQAAPDDPALSWLRLQLCASAPGCDFRDAATVMRWVDAENAAAWLPTLAGAQKDRDSTQVERVLLDMAQSTRFDLYGNRTAVMMFDALKGARGALPGHYLETDLARVDEAMGLAGATVMPSFSPLIEVCHGALAERRDACLALSRTMQRADAVLAQLVGFAIEKRLSAADGRLLRTLAERRKLLEWRVAMANQSDSPLLPWLRNARARARIAKMRTLPREEDVCLALLRDHGIPTEPKEDRR